MKTPCLPKHQPQTLSEALESGQSEKTPLETAFSQAPIPSRQLAKRIALALARNKARGQVPAAACQILPPLP